MKIIKRNGSEVTFDEEKIVKAISKANCAVAEDMKLPRLTSHIDIQELWFVSPTQPTAKF